MLRRAIGHKSLGPPQWHFIVTQVRESRWTEIDPGVHTREGEHPLEAMMRSGREAQNPSMPADISSRR